MDELVDRHFDREVAGDIDGVLATFVDDVSRRSSGDVISTGKDAARRAYEALFTDMRLTSCTTTERWHADGALFDWSMFHAVAIGTPFGLRGDDRPFSFSMLHVFEFRDGLIAREDGWTDILTIQRQLGQ